MIPSAEQIEQTLCAAGLVRLPPGIGGRFSLYLDLLVRWNERMNLTSTRSPEELVRRHFVESANAASYLPEGIHTLLDFGSGAGFPGIPVALCRPEIRVTLAESQSKKAAFLREAVRSLGLGAEVYGGRVEDLPPEQRFDAVILRAVDKMPEAVKIALPRARRLLAVMVAAAAAERYPEWMPELAWRQGLSLAVDGKALLLMGERMEGAQG